MAKTLKHFDSLNKKEQRERLKRINNPKKNKAARRNCLSRFYSL